MAAAAVGIVCQQLHDDSLQCSRQQLKYCRPRQPHQSSATSRCGSASLLLLLLLSVVAAFAVVAAGRRAWLRCRCGGRSGLHVGWRLEWRKRQQINRSDEARQQGHHYALPPPPPPSPAMQQCALLHSHRRPAADACLPRAAAGRSPASTVRAKTAPAAQRAFSHGCLHGQSGQRCKQFGQSRMQDGSSPNAHATHLSGLGTMMQNHAPLLSSPPAAGT